MTMMGPASADRSAVGELRVVSKSLLADGVATLVLEDPGGRRLPDWAPGAHVDLMLPCGLTRQYSLCGDRWDAYKYRIGVLREPESRGGSSYVHSDLKVGDTVEFGGPRNNFPMAPASRYLFIAGGIGITPLLPMIHQAELVNAEWHLLYGGKTRSSMAFLDELAVYGDKVSVVPQDEFGLLDLPAYLNNAQENTKAYCCGPGPLIDAAERQCADWPEGALRIERFVAGEQTPVREEPFEVELRRSGRSITVGPDQSILHAVNDAGANVLSSCGQGLCGTCEIGVLDGSPDHRDSILGDEDRRRGDCMLICVSRSCTDRLVLDL